MFEDMPFMQPIDQDDRDGYGLIPEHTMHSLREYVAVGQPTGGFLEAMLTNDALKASTIADLENVRGFHALARFIACRLPQCCFGSKLVYDRWLLSGGLVRYSDLNDAMHGNASDFDPDHIERLRRLHADAAAQARSRADELTSIVTMLGNSKTDGSKISHGR